MATKAKTPAAKAVPQTREEVQQWITKLGEEQRTVAHLQGEMNGLIAPITEQYAPAIDIHNQEAAALLEGIVTWCEANKTELTNDGKTKTVNLITGEVSWRTNPASVVFKRGIKVDEIIAHIKQLKLGRLFVRSKEEVNKEAILAADDKVKAKLTAAGTIRIVKDAETFTVIPFEQSAT
jgi:phage host-nuclease inhibitor protein Gam